jgi:hypothetical protein
MQIKRSDIVALKELGYGEGCRYIETIHKREMAKRTKDLNIRNRTEAEKVVSKIGGKLVYLNINESTAWAIVFTPLKDVDIYYVYQRYRPEFEDEILTFYGKETAKTEIPVDDLYDFTRLYANALVRTSK